VYTSGTTGFPKACLISHDNMTFVSKIVPHPREFGPHAEAAFRDKPLRGLSFLPLCHIAGFILDIVVPITEAFHPLRNRPSIVYFSRPYDLKGGTIGQTLAAVQPTFFF